MASPIERGSLCATALSSKDIQITHEKLSIFVDKSFKKAHYTVEYHIICDREGKQIPLLFQAMDYDNGFRVMVDGKPLKTDTIQEEYQHLSGTPFQSFSNQFEEGFQGHGLEYSLDYMKNGGSIFRMKDLIYFETDLKKGQHSIRVEYAAKVWRDHSEWVNNYNFRYSLSPAKHWKSFGDLTVELHLAGKSDRITTNLGGKIQERKTVWHFSHLPVNCIIINYKPAISATAQQLIDQGPWLLTLYFSIAFVIAHVIGMWVYRSFFPSAKFAPVMLFGSWIGPFLMLWFYTYSFGIIDHAIGQEAGRTHGYTFFVYVLILILLPLYWLSMYNVDKKIKQRMNERKNRP